MWQNLAAASLRKFFSGFLKLGLSYFIIRLHILVGRLTGAEMTRCSFPVRGRSPLDYSIEFGMFTLSKLFIIAPYFRTRRRRPERWNIKHASGWSTRCDEFPGYDGQWLSICSSDEAWIAITDDSALPRVYRYPEGRYPYYTSFRPDDPAMSRSESEKHCAIQKDGVWYPELCSDNNTDWIQKI